MSFEPMSHTFCLISVSGLGRGPVEHHRSATRANAGFTVGARHQSSFISQFHRKIGLVVIDSIAALFRVEYGAGEAASKAQALFAFGARLKTLAHQYNCVVVCVNQVTIDFMYLPHDSTNRFLISLAKVILPGEKSFLPLAWRGRILSTRDCSVADCLTIAA